jgi:hypothetical protein
MEAKFKVWLEKGGEGLDEIIEKKFRAAFK